MREPASGSTGSELEELAALALGGLGGPHLLPPSGWRDC